jgi:FolB domain-containing protein
MAIIKVKNLRLRTIIGIFDWERDHKQDIIINLKLKFDDSKASLSDDINDTVDYKKLTKRIIAEVEQTSFNLIEKLAAYIINIVMEDKKITAAVVKVDKPHALRFADSVCIQKMAKRK